MFSLRSFGFQVFVARGNRLISCSKDGLVKVWDLATQHCSQTVTGYKAEVWSLDLDPSGKRLVTGGLHWILTLDP